MQNNPLRVGIIKHCRIFKKLQIKSTSNHRQSNKQRPITVHKVLLTYPGKKIEDLDNEFLTLFSDEKSGRQDFSTYDRRPINKESCNTLNLSKF